MMGSRKPCHCLARCDSTIDLATVGSRLRRTSSVTIEVSTRQAVAQRGKGGTIMAEEEFVLTITDESNSTAVIADGLTQYNERAGRLCRHPPPSPC